MNNGNKVVLVAGASSGLGLATANYLFDKGYVVYAAARSYRDKEYEPQRNEMNGVLHKVYLDVTDEESIESLLKKVVGNEGRLDVLINCAVYIVLGSIEDLSMEEFQGVMDTGFYGIVRMCRHAIPYMRDRGKGLIINFSSGAGLVGIPFQGPYCSAKFAIEGFSEVLRWEVMNFGIDVVLFEPGDSNAGSNSYRLHAKKSDSPDSPYYEDFMTVTKKIESDEAGGAEGLLTAVKIHKIINSPKPRIRYNVFRSTEKLLLLKMVLPSRLVESIFFGYYNLKKKKKR